MSEFFGFVRYNNKNKKLSVGPCTNTAGFNDEFYPIANYNSAEVEPVKKLNNSEVRNPYYMYVSYVVENNRARVLGLKALIWIKDIGNGHLYAHGDYITRDGQGKNIIDIDSLPNTVTGMDQMKAIIDAHVKKKNVVLLQNDFPFKKKNQVYPRNNTSEGIVTEIRESLNQILLKPYLNDGYKIGVVLGGKNNLTEENEIRICSGFESVTFAPYMAKEYVCAYYKDNSETAAQFRSNGEVYFVAYKENDETKKIDGTVAKEATQLIQVCDYKNGEEIPIKYKKDRIKKLEISGDEIICDEIILAKTIINKNLSEIKEYYKNQAKQNEANSLRALSEKISSCRNDIKRWNKTLSDKDKANYENELTAIEYRMASDKAESLRKRVINSTNKCIENEEDSSRKLELYLNTKCAYIFKQPFSDFYKQENLEEAKQALIKCRELYEELIKDDPNLATGKERIKSNIDTKWKWLMRLASEENKADNVTSIEEYISNSLTEQEKITLHHMEKPVVTLEKGQVYSFDGKVVVTFDVYNTGGKNRQAAKDVEVSVLPFGNAATNDKMIRLGDIPAGEKRTAHIQFDNSIEDTNKLSFSAFAEYDYLVIDKSVDEGNELKKVHAKIGLSKDVIDENDRLTIEIKFPEKHEVKDTNLNKFDPNGSINFKDEGLKEILKNRDGKINKTISKIKDGDALTQDPRWIMFQGEWRVGKTVILKCLENRIASDFDNAVIVDVSMQNAAASDDFKTTFAEDLYTEIERVSEHLGLIEELQSSKNYAGISDSLLDSNITWNSMKTFMSSFSEAVRKKNKRIVLVIDEFTSLYRAILKDYKSNHEFPELFYSFIESNKLICITAGGEHSNAIMGKYAANVYQKIRVEDVEYLSELDARKYIYYVLDESQSDEAVTEENSLFNGEVSENAVSRVYELTKGNAFLLMKLFTRIVELFNENNSKSIFSEKMINAAISNMHSGDMTKNDEGLTNVEIELFNSLYNPMNENDTDNYEVTNRIEDDEVKKDNILILHALVKYADKNTHECNLDALRNECIKAGMEEDIFEHRYQMLKVRKIIIESNSKDKALVKMRVDLYYEIMHSYV